MPTTRGKRSSAESRALYYWKRNKLSRGELSQRVGGETGVTAAREVPAPVAKELGTWRGRGLSLLGGQRVRPGGQQAGSMRPSESSGIRGTRQRGPALLWSGVDQLAQMQQWPKHQDSLSPFLPFKTSILECVKETLPSHKCQV